MPIPAPAPVRWAAKHGVARVALRRSARQGGLVGRLATDPSLHADPFPTYEQLRARGPLVREPLTLASVDHALVTAVLRSDAFGVGVATGNARAPWPVRAALSLARDPRGLGPVDPPSMLVTDPPAHTRYRKLVTQVFTAKAIARLEDRITQLATELLDGLDGQDRVDLIAAYARLLPVRVIAEILGVADVDRDRFQAWGQDVSRVLDIGMGWPEFRRADKALREINTWGHAQFAQLRRNPGEDLLSRLVTLDDEGDRLSEDELMATALLLFGAGFETTVNLIGSGVVLLARHPDQLALLRAQPELWPNAIEEMLRIAPPVTSTVRVAVRDAEVGGQSFRRGQVMVTVLAGANRDPARFPDPTRFDVARANAKEHVAFSSGIHFCLGSHLAKAEGALALRLLLARYPDLALAGEPVLRPSRTLRGYSAVPVSLGHRAAPAGQPEPAGVAPV